MTKKSAPFAAIDIGTNSFRLLIAEIAGPDRIRPLVKSLITVRLGAGLHRTKTLAPEAVQRGLTALETFAGAVRSHKPEAVRACGTHALRQATNSRDFLRQGEQIIGTLIEIINGRQEAALSLMGALHFLDPQPSGPVLLADVGGGSTELVLAGRNGKNLSASLPLGAVNVTEHCRRPGLPVPTVDIPSMRQHVAGLLGDTVPLFRQDPRLREAIFLGTGGTATALAALALDLQEYDAEKVQGFKLSGRQLASLFHKLVTLAPPARDRLPGLDRGRGGIIAAGTLIYLELLESFGKNEMTTCDAGLLEGILLSISGGKGGTRVLPGRTEPGTR